MEVTEYCLSEMHEVVLLVDVLAYVHFQDVPLQLVMEEDEVVEGILLDNEALRFRYTGDLEVYVLGMSRLVQDRSFHLVSFFPIATKEWVLHDTNIALYSN